MLNTMSHRATFQIVWDIPISTGSQVNNTRIVYSIKICENDAYQFHGICVINNKIKGTVNVMTTENDSINAKI